MEKTENWKGVLVDNMTNPPNVQTFVSNKMNELFTEWLDLESTQKLVRRLIVLASGGM